MNFLGSILLLAGVVCGVLVPVFVGHALSTEGGGRFYLYALVAFVLSAAILAAHVRSVRRLPVGSQHPH